MGLVKKILIGGALITGLWIYSGIKPEKEVRVLYEKIYFERPAQKAREGYVSAKNVQFERYLTSEGEVIEIRDLRTGKSYALADNGGELTITGLGNEIIRKVDDISERLFGQQQEEGLGSLIQMKNVANSANKQPKQESNYKNWLRR